MRSCYRHLYLTQVAIISCTHAGKRWILNASLNEALVDMQISEKIPWPISNGTVRKDSISKQTHPQSQWFAIGLTGQWLYLILVLSKRLIIDEFRPRNSPFDWPSTMGTTKIVFANLGRLLAATEKQKLHFAINWIKLELMTDTLIMTRQACCQWKHCPEERNGSAFRRERKFGLGKVMAVKEPLLACMLCAPRKSKEVNSNGGEYL